MVSPDERRDIVRVLRDEGKSVRAIARAVGASKTTIERDLEALARDTEPAVEPETPVDIDELLLSGRQVWRTITPADLGEITQSEQTISDDEYEARFGSRREPPTPTLADIPPGRVRIRHKRLDQAATTTCFACTQGSCKRHGVRS